MFLEYPRMSGNVPYKSFSVCSSIVIGLIDTFLTLWRIYLDYPVMHLLWIQKQVVFIWMEHFVHKLFAHGVAIVWSPNVSPLQVTFNTIIKCTLT